MQELYHIEISMIRSIEEESFDPYTCRVRDLLPELACLDVASESTHFEHPETSPRPARHGRCRILHDQRLRFVVHQHVWKRQRVSERRSLRGKRIGDGMLDSFDVLVYLLHYFRIQPYNSLVDNPSYVLTVEGEDDVDHRCQNEGDRTRYINFMAINDDCARPSLFGPVVCPRRTRRTRT